MSKEQQFNTMLDSWLTAIDNAELISHFDNYAAIQTAIDKLDKATDLLIKVCRVDDIDSIVDRHNYVVKHCLIRFYQNS